MANSEAHWEHFEHGADIGVRGIGPTRERAFIEAARALTAVVTELDVVADTQPVTIRCTAPDNELLLVEWLNALVYEMATRRMLFSRFELSIEDLELFATAWGEAVDRERHEPAVEVKGATLTELRVAHTPDGGWLAQCIVDV